MNNYDIAIPAGAPARDIPPLPGGGSWTFNESTWKWEENIPSPAGVGDNNAQEA